MRSEIAIQDVMELVEIIQRGIESWEENGYGTIVTQETLTEGITLRKKKNGTIETDYTDGHNVHTNAEWGSFI